MTRSLQILQNDIVHCDRCPRLRDHCKTVARKRRRAYADFEYWGQPVPGFGDPKAQIMIIGLAPGAHGANRTGRVFTGDRSGDFLYAGLHEVGLASQAESTDRDDGMQLANTWITCAARCAPPGNKPSTGELDNCRPWLIQEVQILQPRVLLALGGIGWQAALKTLKQMGETIPRPQPRFGHGAEIDIGSRTLLGCYHVSQQNTFTGRLTPQMLETVLKRAGEIAG